MKSQKLIGGICALSWALLTSTALAQTGPTIPIADGTTLEDMHALCKDMIIINVDGKFLCQAKITDSMDAIITDMQRDDLERDPVQAGQEGNRAALRHLPDVSLSAATNSANYSRGLLSRYKALDTSGLAVEKRLNYQLLGYVLGQRLDARRL